MRSEPILQGCRTDRRDRADVEFGRKTPRRVPNRAFVRQEHALFPFLAGLLGSIGACSSEGQLPPEQAGSGGVASASGDAGNGGTSGGTSGGVAGSAGSGGVAAGGGGGSFGGGGTGQVGGSGGSSSGSGGTSGGGGGGGTFSLSSPALENVVGCSVENPSVCDVFPDENVSYLDNANLSPELSWTGVPPGTQSFALVLFDVTFGQAHWVLWNIPADVSMLAANVPKDTATPPAPAGSRQANANFATTGGDGYFGPHLPCNVFEFELYALSSSTFSPLEPESAVLVSIELQELGDPVLGVARLTGRSNDYDSTCE
jgi:phosphatidylethanolamine-binding protein (PEBP) family uncharacterized protein